MLSFLTNIFVICVKTEVLLISRLYSVVDPSGPFPPCPVKINHKKDGCQRRPHRFHVSCPPFPTTRSATGVSRQHK